MEVREEQPLKALPPILVKPSGIVMAVRALQPAKALSSILVTLSGIVVF
jgi:hypothetical protein